MQIVTSVVTRAITRYSDSDARRRVRGSGLKCMQHGARALPCAYGFRGSGLDARQPHLSSQSVHFIPLKILFIPQSPFQSFDIPHSLNQCSKAHCAAQTTRHTSGQTALLMKVKPESTQCRNGWGMLQTLHSPHTHRRGTSV